MPVAYSVHDAVNDRLGELIRCAVWFVYVLDQVVIPSQEPPLQKPEQHSISDSQSPSMYIQVQTISEFKPHPVPFVHPCMTSSVVQSRPPSISSQSSRASLNVASSTHSSESPTYDVPNTSSSNLRHFPSRCRNRVRHWHSPGSSGRRAGHLRPLRRRPRGISSVALHCRTLRCGERPPREGLLTRRSLLW